jgi:formiminoglutamate deiminase
VSFWVKHAWLPDGIADRVQIEVADGRIVAITTDVPAGPADVSLEGLLLPGLANGHSHAFHRALRGRTHANGGTFWTWRQEMYRLASRLTPDRYLELATAVYAEMALAGYTVVGEFHYLHHDHSGQPYADPNAMGAALIEAAANAGLRLTLLDTCYLAGGLSSEGHLALDEVQRRFRDQTVASWHDRWSRLPDTHTTRIGTAVHSVRAVPAEALSAVAEAAAGRPLHVHLSEQPAENAATQAFYGCSPSELLDQHGLLGKATTAVHATHLSDTDVLRLGGSGTAVCFCPSTEADLADGLGPARALRDAGTPLTLGSDQHAIIDPFAELRGLELGERLRSGSRGRFPPDELLTAASRAGYESLGWPDGGVLTSGALADFVTVRTDSVRTAGSRADQVLYAATAVDVADVVIAGEHVVSAGTHRLGSVAELLTSAHRRLESA